MLKILQARLQQYMNQEFPDVQGGFRKCRGTRDQIANICWVIEKAEEPDIKWPIFVGSWKKQENYRKTSASLAMPLTGWITANSGKFLKRWEYPTTLPASCETCMQLKKQQLELDMEQTGSKSGKEYIKAVYCHPAYLTYMQSTS